MTILQLQYFRVLAKTCHFTKASEQLLISQSTLSHAISELEKELGVLLFERIGKKIYLSQYGAFFLLKIEDILDQLDNACNQVKTMANAEYGRVNISFLPSLATNFINNFINVFYKQNPTKIIEINIMKGKLNSQILDLLEKGEADLAICSQANNKTMEYCVIFIQNLLLYVSPNHPFSNRHSVDISEVNNQPYVHMAKGNSTRNLVDQILTGYKITPKVIAEKENFAAVASFIANDFGISLLPPSKEIELYGAKPVKITNANCQRKVYLAWMKNIPMTPAISKVREFLMENGISIYSESMLGLKDDN